MAKVVAFMDEGRSHGNDLTAALLPPATAAPAQDSAPQLSPQQLPAPSHRQDPPPPPQVNRIQCIYRDVLTSFAIVQALRLLKPLLMMHALQVHHSVMCNKRIYHESCGMQSCAC